jgi:O-methyltransferase
MSRLRQLLRGPLQSFRRLTGKPLTPLETALQFSIYNDVPGDYLEFGVFTGNSFAHSFHYYNSFLAGYLKRNKLNTSEERCKRHRRFFAFDSFEGLPVTDQKHLPSHWRGEGVMSYPQARFISNLRRRRVDLAHVVIVPGFYNVSLTDDLRKKHVLTAAAIVHVDCDLYESTVPVLDFVWPVIVDGTVIVFDDWFFYKGHPAKGERAAFEQWLAKHPEIVSSPLCLQFPAVAFILNFRDA